MRSFVATVLVSLALFGVASAVSCASTSAPGATLFPCALNVVNIDAGTRYNVTGNEGATYGWGVIFPNNAAHLMSNVLAPQAAIYFLIDNTVSTNSWNPISGSLNIAINLFDSTLRNDNAIGTGTLTSTNFFTLLGAETQHVTLQPLYSPIWYFGGDVTFTYSILNALYFQQNLRPTGYWPASTGTMKFSFGQLNNMPNFFGSTRPTFTNRVFNASESTQFGPNVQNVLFSTQLYDRVAMGWGGTCYDWSTNQYCANTPNSQCCSGCTGQTYGMDLGFGVSCATSTLGGIHQSVLPCSGSCTSNAAAATVSGQCASQTVSATTSMKGLTFTVDPTVPCVPPNINVGDSTSNSP